MVDKEPNGWAEWSRHVLLELKRLNDLIEDVLKRVDANRTKMTVLETQTLSKEGICRQHRETADRALEMAQENKNRISTHRLLAVLISSIASIIVALVTVGIATNH